ncbi:MAG: dTDP-4-dehydrorhamnose reductase [Gammaproteobacteria bacterium]|nr:dTDP-4-dehydrorhamnose reductase [Gammaproteobacteria bacterium]
MKILLLGKDGQVGWELQRALAPLGELVACGRREADLEQPDSLRKLIHNVAPQIVVNAAAYTAVDRAETEGKRARNINTDALNVLAEEMKKHNGWLIHYSTDYVFDGSKKGAYLETDVTSPLSVYGESKRDGELAITASNCQHLIFRSSWVFAVRGSNFIKTILRLAKEREELSVINDQYGAPTGADLIADVTALVLYRLRCEQSFADKVSGIYHLTASGETSWYGYASYILEEAVRHNAKLGVTPEKVYPISTTDYPLPARRPANSRLNTQKIRDTFGLTLPSWQTHVKRTIAELLQGIQ